MMTARICSDVLEFNSSWGLSEELERKYQAHTNRLGWTKNEENE